jgi:F0F1-type ATP synthase assembly protein I
MNEQDNPENNKPTPYDLWPIEPPPSEEPVDPFHAPFVPIAYTPETTEENIRQGGLAWSAGIVFFGSVAFMLFLGWLADLLLGSSPWGIVGGIVLGSIIGFIQFFRISSQIFGPKKETDHKPFLSRDDDEK